MVDFNGRFITPIRQAITNAKTSDEALSGVPRCLEQIPVTWDSSGGDPNIYDVQAQRYRSLGSARLEYMIFAATSGNIGWLDSPDWWFEGSDATVIPGDLTVLSMTGDAYEDGTPFVTVRDEGSRTLGSVLLLVVARGDKTYDDQGWIDEDSPLSGRTGTEPYEVIPLDSGNLTGTPGLIRLDAQDLVDLSGGLSLERGDRVITARYTLTPVTFHWSKNDSDATRFGFRDRLNRWAPLKGGTPTHLGFVGGDLQNLDPTPVILPVNAYLPTDDPNGGDTYAMIRVGLNPGQNSTVLSKVKIVLDSDVESESFAGGIEGVVGRTSGQLRLNDALLDALGLTGQPLWYIPLTFKEDSTGDLGLMSDAILTDVYLAPPPEYFERPLIRFGSRRYLAVRVFDSELAMDQATINRNEVLVASTTGRVRFHPNDLLKAQITAPLFDRAYVDEHIFYDGVVQNAVPQPLAQPLPLVNSLGDPTIIQGNNELLFPNSRILPDEFVLSNRFRGLGQSGIHESYDGTGIHPGEPATPAEHRPINTGRVRSLSCTLSGDYNLISAFLFSRRSQLELISVNRVDDLPSASRVQRNQAFVALEDPSPVVLSRGDRRLNQGELLYVIDPVFTPATYTNRARIPSRIRDFYRLDGSEALTVIADGVSSTWTSAALVALFPDRSLFSAAEVALDIQGSLLSGECVAIRGRLVLKATDESTGSLEIPFQTGQEALGFIPGVRVVGSVDNWIPDSGIALQMFRSPANLNRETTGVDYRSEATFDDVLLTDSVQAIPYLFLDRVPLRDAPGYGVDEFFRLENVIQEGDAVEILRTTLTHYGEVVYQFEASRMAWASDVNSRVALISPVNQVFMGVPGVFPVSFQEPLGGRFAVSEDGSGVTDLVLDEDYLFPDSGASGRALLIDRVAPLVLSGSGGLTDGLGRFLGFGFTAQEGDRLTLEGQGSYRVVTTGTSVETEPVLEPSVKGYSWELYRDAAEGILADVVFVPFNHLPFEPFLISTLTPLTQGQVAPLGEALQSSRSLSLRVGLEHPSGDGSNVLSLIPLTTTPLGTLANDGLIVPNVDSIRFATLKFEVQVGRTAFTPEPVLTFSNDPGSSVEVLTQDWQEPFGRLHPKGELKFGSGIFDDFTGSPVFVRETFLSPGALDLQTAEYDPLTLEINVPSSVVSSEIFLVEAYVAGSDVGISPVLGSLTFFTPLRAGQVVEVTYYQADLSGARVGSPITEFLPVYVTREVAQRISPKVWVFNLPGETQRRFDPGVQPVVYTGVIQRGFGTTEDFSVVVQPDLSVQVLFQEIFPDTTTVMVTYAALDAFGGERSYDTSLKPLYRPPFFIKANARNVGLRGDRTADFRPGQMLRLGSTCLYLKRVIYFAAQDVTSLVVFPPPLQEVGSRAPGQDVITVLTDRPITSQVDPSDPVVIPDAVGSFWDLVDLPFDPANRNATRLIFTGSHPSFVEGHALDLAGYPFVITQVETSEDGNRTLVTLGSPLPRGFSSDQDPVFQVSRRPLYLEGSTVLLPLGGVYRDEPLKLVQYEEGQPGQDLTEGVDYRLDDQTGAVTLAQGLRRNGRLEATYTRIKTLAPTVVNGQTLNPILSIRGKHNTTPSVDNGYLNAQVRAKFTYYQPDTFYAKVETLPVLLQDVARNALREIEAKSSTAGTITSVQTNASSLDGVLGLRSEVQDLYFKDLAGRRFLSFYHSTVEAWDQIVEVISGQVIGDHQGRFKFRISPPSDYALPGGEDTISFLLNPRLLWRTLFEEGNNTLIFTVEDNVVVPSTATLLDGLIVGDFYAPDRLNRDILRQLPLALNSIDDVALLDGGRVFQVASSSPPFYTLRTKGQYRSLYESHRLSRLFPTNTRGFARTFPGIDGVYTWGRFLLGDFRSTYRTTVAQLSNPVLGTITQVQSAQVFKRRARARLFEFRTEGFPEFDAELTMAGEPTFTANPRPAVLVTVRPFSEILIDPLTGLPVLDQFISQGGETYDALSGDLDLATPAFEVGDQVAWGLAISQENRLALYREPLDIFGTPAYSGVFVGEVLLGCILTFASADGVGITDPDRILSGTAPDSGEPAYEVLTRGDTVFVTSPTGLSSALADPPNLDALSQAAGAMDTYREGFDLAVRASGAVVDLTLPSRDDPFFLPLKEMLGQHSLDPVTTIEALLEISPPGEVPLQVPALQGDFTDDAGDYQIPYLRVQNTELDRLDQVQIDASTLLTAQGPSLGYVYPDEIFASGDVVDTLTALGSTWIEPATLHTVNDHRPVFNGSTSPGIGDTRPFDVLLVSTSGSNPTNLQGILSVGAITTLEPSVGDFQALVEVPRFVTPTTERSAPALTGSSVRYVFDHAMVYTNDPLTEPYPVDPQAIPTPTGVRVSSDTGTGLTTLEFSDLALLALNDGVTAGAGNLNDLYSSNPLDERYNNVFTFRLIARTDSNITTGPSGPAPLPVPGEVVYTMRIHGETVDTEDYIGNLNSYPITGVVFGTNTPVLPAPLDNRQIQISAVAAWFDFQGVGAAAQAAWYLPHTEAAGVKTSIYGWEFSLSVDTWVVPSAAKGGSQTAWIGNDRLTFHESMDLRHVKRRGYTHPLSGLDLEGQLVVQEVTLFDGTASRVNAFVNGDTLGTPIPFTFPVRSSTETGSYYHESAGGLWSSGSPDDGSVKVPSWEGYDNTSISTLNLVARACPSSDEDSIGVIAQGVGLTESKDNTSLVGFYAPNFDDRITGVTLDLNAVEDGDVCVIQAADDATHKASTKAGTYLVRYALTASPLTGGFYQEQSWTSFAGSPEGPMGLVFPTSLGYDSGTNRLGVSDLLSFKDAPLLPGLTPSAFEVTGRVYVILDVSRLNSADPAIYRLAAVSADYTGIDEGTLEFTGLNSWQDALNVALTEAEFEALVNAGAYAVSGFSYLPAQVVLNQRRLVGWDEDPADDTLANNSIFGARDLTLRPNPLIQGTAEISFNATSTTPITASQGVISRAVGTPGTVTAIEAPVVASTDFIPDLTDVVYPHTLNHFFLGDITDGQWATLQNPPLSAGGGVAADTVHCLLPVTALVFEDPLGNPGYYAQAGIFLEPSFPRQVFDLVGGSPHVVDAGHSLLASELGMRNAEDFIGLDNTGAPLAPPTSPEQVEFSVRRIRRFHAAQDDVVFQFQALRYAYEMRRGRITTYTPPVIPGQRGGLLQALNFTMTFNVDEPLAPRAPDVWNTGDTFTGTQLGFFNTSDVNIQPGDTIRILDDEGALVEQCDIASVQDASTLVLAAPGLNALLSYVGVRFEVYLRSTPVPHEQSYAQLLELMTSRVVHETFADEVGDLGGYVPEFQPGDTWEDVANHLYDDLNVVGATTFSSLGVRPGDLVLIDPMGTKPNGEKGVRPFGDRSVPDRAEHVPGTPNPLDDNRGFYRVIEVHDDHLVVNPETFFTGTLDEDVVFPEGAAASTHGFAIYPTVSGSLLNDAPYVNPPPVVPREGQNDLRPTRLPDGVTGSWEDYGDGLNAYSIRPFSYRIIRPSNLISRDHQDMILSGRERILSFMEELLSLMSGLKSGNYFVFQRDEHLGDLGTLLDTESGLGILDNSVLTGVLGEVGIVPFTNTSDALSVLDRRFWIHDQRLERLTEDGDFQMKVVAGLDVPYLEADVVLPLLPELMDGLVLNGGDRMRPLRWTWIVYRTHRTRGTLVRIKNALDQLPKRLDEAQRQILLNLSTQGVLNDT